MKRPPCTTCIMRYVTEFAYAGKWYRRTQCQKCYQIKDTCIRDVDQSDDRDCEAADRSQGIV
jgi:hypothetical protein